MKFLPLRFNGVRTSEVKESAELNTIRRNIIRLVFLIAIILGSLAYFSNIYLLVQTRDWLVAGVQTFVYSTLLVLTLADKLPLRVRTFGLLFIVLLLAVAELLETGLVGEGRIFLVTFALLAMILLDFRQALAMIALSLVMIAIIAGLMTNGLLPPPDFAKIDDSTRVSEWFTGTAIYLLVTGLISAALVTLIRDMQQAVANQKKLSLELEQERSALEVRVQERTTALQQRAAVMQIVADFSHNLQSLRKQDEMLALLADTFRKELHIPNICIFIPDPTGRHYSLDHYDGELAQTIFNTQGKIWVKTPGAFVNLIDSGNTLVLRNAGEHSIYFHQSGFSSVYAIVLLPFRSFEEKFGAICLFYADEPEMDEEQLQIYRGLADQLATALGKAGLLSSLQKNVEELKISGQELTRKTWRGYIKSNRQTFSLRYNNEKIEAGKQHSQFASQAFHEHRIVIRENEERGGSTLAIPIMLRDEPFGVIDMRFEENRVPENLVTLVETASKRLALALDNARLMEQIQTRADREAAISALAARIRASNDVNGILKIAATEIGHSFGASEVLVQLRTDDNRHPAAENS